MSIKSFRYKIRRPSKRIVQTFEQWLEICRELYNAGLQERRDAWKLNKIAISCFEQINQLPEIKLVRSDLVEINATVLQDVLRRLDKTFKGFFSRVKKGEKSGFPRFKSQNRYNSFTFPQIKSTVKLQGDKLSLSKIGIMRIRLSRDIAGKIKTCTIKREIDGWYAIFACETEKELLLKTGESIGIDVGLENFATLSNGEQIENPRFLRKSERSLRIVQRALSRKKKGSKNRKKSIYLLKKQHLKIVRQRQDFLYKLANKLTSRFDEIAVEELQIRNMMKTRHFAKSIADASWGNFLTILEYKAENAGKRVWKVNPRGTSQTCICGETVKKALSVRHHNCLKCGHSEHRDIVSAKVILNRAVGQTVETLTHTTR